MPANQSHKNRLQAKKEAGYSIYPTFKKASKMADAANRNPAMNPAGKAQYEGKVRVIYNEPMISPKPDPARAARKRARKTVTTPAYKPGK